MGIFQYEYGILVIVNLIPSSENRAHVGSNYRDVQRLTWWRVKVWSLMVQKVAKVCIERAVARFVN